MLTAGSAKVLRRWLHRILGLEGSYLDSDQDIEFGGNKVASLDQTAITAAHNFHIVPTKSFDLWVTPVASWVD